MYLFFSKYNIIFLMVWILNWKLLVFADSNPVSKNFNETIFRSQCEARCLSLYGEVIIPVEYEILPEVYKPYSCKTPDDTCHRCMSACNYPLTTVKQCKKSCVQSSCRESCQFLFKVSHLNSTISHSEDIGVTTPQLVCQGIQRSKPLNHTAYLYLGWSAWNGTRPSTLPLVFVLSSHGVVFGKTTSSLVAVKELTAGGRYRMQITAVSPKGIVSPTVSSTSIITSPGRRVPRPPSTVNITSFNPRDNGVSVVVEWIPDNSTMNCYYSLYWMSAGSEHNDFKKLDVPLPIWRYEMEGLNYGENYTLYIYSYDDVMREEESQPAIVWFFTPECLPSLNYSIQLCAPPSAVQLSTTLLPVSDTTASVLLTWSISINSTQFNYSLGYVRTPGLSSVFQPPHRDTIILPASVTNYTVLNLHVDSWYKFYLSAISVGGGSDIISSEVFTGRKQSHASEYQLTTTSIPRAAARVPYVEIIVPIVSLLFTAVLIYAVCRVKYGKKSQLPFIGTSAGVVMTELNYMLDRRSNDLEVDINCFEWGCELGAGAFGRVLKAKVIDIAGLPSTLHKDMTVAVKTLHDYATCVDKSSFLKEIALMKQVGRHPCIVSMLACSTLPNSLCIVLDYCSKGDLRSYLRHTRETLTGNMPSPITTGSTKLCGYMEFPYSDLSYTNSTQSSAGDSTTEESTDITFMFLSFSRQIAFGMEYLARRKFVHRDLAARNILVCEGGKVKIADFGLTRDVYENSVYYKQGGGKLPVKWMAIESIFDQTYTTQSDVWSYGVVLWEIVTMGASPYPGVDNSQLLHLLKDGYRMEKPDHCSQELYNIMLRCWSVSPSHRPNFTDLVAQVEGMLENSSYYLRICSDTSGYNSFESL